jgi:recombinational DNA repair protein (RecF pathway)
LDGRAFSESEGRLRVMAKGTTRQQKTTRA